MNWRYLLPSTAVGAVATAMLVAGSIRLSAAPAASRPAPRRLPPALVAYPELSCRGGPFEVRTRWGVEPNILCAGNDRAVAFVQEVLAEVCAVFPSRFIHTTDSVSTNSA